MPAPIATWEALHAPFHPRAVAVIGALDGTIRHGDIALTNLRNTGFTGSISRLLAAIDITFVIPGESVAIAIDAPPEPTA